MLQRWCKASLKILAVLAVLLLLFLVIERVRGQISLARYKKALAAQGEKLTPRGLQVSNAIGENAAPAVLEAIKRLTNGVVLPRGYPPRMKLTPAGRAVVGFREPEWVEDQRTNQWDELAMDLKTNEALLVEIRAHLEKPVLNNGLDLSLGAKMPISHLSPAKSLTYWLGSGSQLALHTGNTRAALPDLLTVTRLPRLLAEDGILISELVRIAIGAIAKADSWEALQADGWTDEDLARLQEAWVELDFIRGMARSLEGERIYMAAAHETMRQSNDEAVGIWFGWEQFLQPEDSSRPAWERVARHLPLGEEIADFLKKQVYCRVWRFAWSYQAELRNLQETQRLLELSRQAAAKASFASVRDAFAQLERASTNRSVYDRLCFPEPLADSGFSLSRSVSKALRAETDRSMTICAIALKRYSLRHGRLPASLDALVPEFVSAVPVDWMDGKPLRYRLNADGSFQLYSVGENLMDDCGDTSLLPDHAGSRALWFKKDYVWPAPATPEEVEAYRQEAAKQ